MFIHITPDKSDNRKCLQLAGQDVMSMRSTIVASLVLVQLAGLGLARDTGHGPVWPGRPDTGRCRYIDSTISQPYKTLMLYLSIGADAVGNKTCDTKEREETCAKSLHKETFCCYDKCCTQETFNEFSKDDVK